MLPTEVANLVCWFRADDIPLLPGQQVQTWPDRTGRTAGATQSNAAARPLLRTNFAHPSVEFDGVDDVLPIATQVSTKTSDYSWLVVSYIHNPIAKITTAFYNGNGGANGWGYFPYGGDAGAGKRTILHGGVAFLGSADTHQNGVIEAIYGGRDATTSSMHRSNNAVPLTNGATGAPVTPAGPTNIGDISMQGHIFDVAMWNRYLTEAERTGIFSYVQERYGVTVAGYSVTPERSQQGNTTAIPAMTSRRSRA